VALHDTTTITLLPKVDTHHSCATISTQTKEKHNEKFVDDQERNHCRGGGGSDRDSLQFGETCSQGSGTSSETSRDCTGDTSSTGQEVITHMHERGHKVTLAQPT